MERALRPPKRQSSPGPAAPQKKARNGSPPVLEELDSDGFRNEVLRLSEAVERWAADSGVDENSNGKLRERLKGTREILALEVSDSAQFFRSSVAGLTVALSEIDTFDNEPPYINRIVRHPDDCYRGMGLAHIENAVQLSQNSGWGGKVSLMPSGPAAVLEFYQQLGFRLDDIDPFMHLDPAESANWNNDNGRGPWRYTPQQPRT